MFGSGGTVEIVLNGERQEVEPGLTVAELLRRMNMKPQYAAVERNLELVPRSQHAECQLQPGDRLEVVTLVGGG